MDDFWGIILIVLFCGPGFAFFFLIQDKDFRKFIGGWIVLIAIVWILGEVIR
ncbi:hypothetical protein G3A_07085 [Bacillus sp. 17376]|uniref:Uncharacterized protein n=1 Tax=Mesobacillus boroniphilus JCM 21738 TaxID=1294265 RepID=W4RRE9_9BACI|nr:hypothetical protein [Mesobacillus boroniphilus]ESU33276.1 hypothetical protein G3A_07085 [Bacillus sp. 17376]GAE46194.1 hypothetical protein JCM21738_3074 [Mesobacillus boroniphilus JCM 21738]